MKISVKALNSRLLGNHRVISYANLLHTLKRGQRRGREGRASSSFLRSLGGELVGFRARHADDRAKSAVLGMRISRRQEALGKKTGEKAQKCVIACLDYTVTLASSMARRYLSFRNAVSSLFLSFFLLPIRDGERNRTKETAPIAPQRLPYHIPHLLGFLSAAPLSLSLFFLIILRVPPVILLLRCSRRFAAAKLTQPLHQDPLNVRDETWTRVSWKRLAGISPR